jgi:hypothetical protein
MGINEETYVYDGVEVRKTGRKANKQVKLPSNRNMVDPSVKLFQLVEISPVDTSGFQWTKWVKESELYVIVK